MNDFGRIEAWRKLLDRNAAEQDARYSMMLHVLLWDKTSLGWDLAEAHRRLQANPNAIRDIQDILDYLSASATIPDNKVDHAMGPLRIGGLYFTNEILVGLERWSLSDRPSMREGVLHLPDKRLDVMFVTLQKTEEDYSPTTMYEDYFISQDLFHWRTQSRTSVNSPTGQRYIDHRRLGYTPILFVRDIRKTPAANTAPYRLIGPCDYVSHEGSRPISITWRLRHRVPMPIYRQLNQQVAG